jgi:hypothetical protein
MTPSEIRRSIENRIWSLASRYPEWWGHGPLAKRAATPAQLVALTKAREAREHLTAEDDARERRLAERIKTQAAY